jgi:hypothetical protein
MSNGDADSHAKFPSSSPELVDLVDAPVGGSNDTVESGGSEQEDVFEVAQLHQNFSQLVEGISQRVNSLSESARKSVMATHRHLLDDEIARADKQIGELKNVMAQCDELEVELLKIRQIGEIARGFKDRILDLEVKLI